MSQYKQHHMSKKELKENKLITVAINFRHFVINNKKTILRSLLVLSVALVLLLGKLIYNSGQEKDAATKLNKALFLLQSSRDKENINLVQKQLTRIVNEYSGTGSAARASYHLGVIQYTVQGYLKAIQSFRIAAEDGASHITGSALIGIGDAYTQLNNPKKALESYQLALEKKIPGFTGIARSKTIQVMIALGRFKEARREIQLLKKDRDTRFSQDVPRLQALLSLFEKQAGITKIK